jgi:dihydrofolate reductase
MITALFAVDETGGMGKNGTLPWPFNKDDMIWFKRKTQNQVVVMGKKSWESPDMPKPLPNRHNIVFTNNFFDHAVEQIKGDVCEGLKHIESQHPDKEVFVIGGANLLIQSTPVIQKAFVTKILGNFDCDTKIDMSLFLKNMALVNTHNIGSCKVEEYEAIPRRT